MTDPRDVLTIWTITYDTSDFPGQFVVRGHDVFRGYTRPHANPLGVTTDLEAARALIPKGLAPFDRAPGDDPVIVESWL